jgi:uncharacterized protein with GYD domain
VPRGSRIASGFLPEEEAGMPKVLWKVSYTVDGIKGVLKEGGSARRAAAEAAIKSVGGTMEAFYFAFGDADVYVIADLPDNEAGISASLNVTAAGGARLSTTVLLTPEEFDRAVGKSVEYRPPGG